MKPPPAPSAIARFLDRFQRSLGDGSFVRLVLSTPTAGAHPVVRVLGRVVDLKDGSVLSLTEREAQRDTTRNVPVAQAPAWLAGQLGSRFRGALLGTRTRDWQLSVDARGVSRLVEHPPSRTEAPPRSHDRPKPALASAESSPEWLKALGLVDAAGKVYPSRAAKHRQMVRYAEILGHLLADAGFPADEPIHLADMGCGKGYLTFAAWQLLRRATGPSGTVTGIESRLELAAEAEATARQLGCEGLQFRAGTIADAAFDGARLDVLIALHACNTATDDALRRGIELGCRLIVVALCCHQELRPQLGHPEPLAPILAHGLMAERFAEWLTDGLRALHLEWAGYRTKVIEFVGSEHTPKNLLISAVHDPARTPFADGEAKRRIERLRAFFQLPDGTSCNRLETPG